MAAQAAPKTGFDVPRAPLESRLKELSRQAIDALSPIELAWTVGACFLSLTTFVSGTLYWINNVDSAFFDAHDRLLPWAIALGFVCLAGLLTAAARRWIRTSFRAAYRDALSDLHGTTLSIVVADEALRAIVRELRDA